MTASIRKTLTIYVKPDDQDLFRVAGLVLKPSLSAWIAAKVRAEIEGIKHKTIGEILDESGKTIEQLLGDVQ